ncbi:MAG: TRAP transporter small permease subunit [Rubrivivax sp.]|jgi:TRAP-type C4-dicarboxylate transport system permease small subunit|nr:TRAP transporter small permease subunit [Rubrivivax sp.]
MKRLFDIGTGVSRALAWLGGAMLLVSAALISLDVVFRAAFKLNIFESFELSTYAFAISTSLGMSYALVTRAHIRIELLYVKMPLKGRAWLDVAACTGLAVCLCVLLYWAGQLVMSNWAGGARSNSALAIRLAWPQGLWLLGLAWFALLALLYAVVGLWQCLRGRHEAVHERLGVASLKQEIDASTARAESPAC